MSSIYTGMSDAERKQYQKRNFIQMKADYCDGLLDKKSYIWFYVQYLMNYIKYRIREKCYCKDMQEYEDLIGEAITAIAEHIDQYNPEIAGPATFFTPYIDERIKEYIRPTEMSSYYDGVKRKLNQVAKEAGYEGLSDTRLTAYALSVMSGISLTTVNEVRERASYTKESLDSYEDNIVDERSKTPEELLVNREATRIMYDALLKCTPLEQFLLLAVEANDKSLKKTLEFLKQPEVKKTSLGREIIPKMTQDYLARKLQSGKQHLRRICGESEEQMYERAHVIVNKINLLQPLSIQDLYVQFINANA